MAYITPNSTIYLLKHIPLDKSYKHTLFSPTETTRYNAFMAWNSQQRVTLNNYTYQRYTDKSIRVEMPCDSLYGYNYMMFQNTAFGDKWFYAFIDDVRYINNATTEIVYTIDVIQSWFDTYHFGQCYVEREHTLTDNPTENYVPENFGELEPYIIKSTEYDFSSTVNDWKIVVLYIPQEKNGSIEKITTYDLQTKEWGTTTAHSYVDNGHLLNGIYFAGSWVEFTITDGSTQTGTITEIAINKLFIKLTEIGAVVLAAYLVPYNMPAPNDLPAYNLDNVKLRQIFYVPITKSTYNNYSFKNNKLLMSPFHYYELNNNQGGSVVLKPEMFNNYYAAEIQFFGSSAPSPSILAVPADYNERYGSTTKYNYQKALPMSNFPTINYSIDSYRDWYAQNKNSYALGWIASGIKILSTAAGVALGAVAAGAATGGVGAVAGGTAGGAAGAVLGEKVSAQIMSSEISGVASVSNSILNQINTAQVQIDKKDSYGGGIADNALSVQLKRFKYTLYEIGLTPEKLKIIDDYFTMFGYAIKQLKVPNVELAKSGTRWRPHWNYLKLTQVAINADSDNGIPAAAEEMCEKIYQNGITFWNSLSEVGDYSLDNSPRPQT